MIGYIDDLIFTPELDYLDEVSKGLRPRLQSSNLVAQLQATVAGAGICVLPHFMAVAASRASCRSCRNRSRSCGPSGSSCMPT